MKIGILVTSVGDFGEKGFYNNQEIGLAKELDKLADQVTVYKLIPRCQLASEEKIEGCHHTVIKMLPSRNYGINGWIQLETLDKKIDYLIFFSDTQLCVPKVYKWAKKNKVKLFPYIGVIESHSDNCLKKLFINFLFKRNLKVYRQCHCFVKTASVEKDLKMKGVKNITIAPVGLDVNLLNKEFKTADKGELKKKYGFHMEDQIILFVGRLVEEKQPLRMIEIFTQVYSYDSKFKLLMVGAGPLKDVVNKKINSNNLKNSIKIIEKIPNIDIWEVYYMADCLVNLNQQEIFGMAILEAMYYGCRVIAWHAPGPDTIIDSPNDGILCKSNVEIIEAIKSAQIPSKKIHKKIVDRFSWKYTAYKIKKCFDENEGAKLG